MDGITQKHYTMAFDTGLFQFETDNLVAVLQVVSYTYEQNKHIPTQH
jgi:hypothetical protein